jgi:hypothetical protein
MEALTRLVADSLARHGLDRPVDPRRLQWSRWFRCDSPRSLLVVPSKPGIFALAEEMMELGNAGVGTGASPAQAERSSAIASSTGTSRSSTDREGHDFSRADNGLKKTAALAAEEKRRLLAVLQFSEDDDMAFTLDRMFAVANPMRARLVSGNCFLRFVVIDDPDQRRTICAALNQWVRSSAEKVTGFSSLLEFTHVGRTPSSAGISELENHVERTSLSAAKRGFQQNRENQNDISAAHLDSGTSSNLHCPQPFPSGF